MKNDLKEEFKTQLESNLRTLIVNNLEDSSEISELFKGVLVMKIASSFLQNIKANYSKSKSDFAKNWDTIGFSQNEYNAIADNDVEQVLGEFISSPKKSKYDDFLPSDFWQD
jgi:hypothetical protein